MNRILIAEDEAPIANLVKTALSDAGYACVWAADGNAAADLLETTPFDLVLLDIMLPKANGYEVLDYCKALDVPVIFLTAKGSVEDRVYGLHLGAEDYITKPFNILELKARIKAILRRSNSHKGVYKDSQNTLQIRNLELEFESRRVFIDGKETNLTAKEFDLLELFMENPGKVYSREKLLDTVWGYDYPGDVRTVDVHVRRLREKIEENPSDPKYIFTKWGVGYYFN